MQTDKDYMGSHKTTRHLKVGESVWCVLYTNNDSTITIEIGRGTIREVRITAHGTKYEITMPGWGDDYPTAPSHESRIYITKNAAARQAARFMEVIDANT